MPTQSTKPDNRVSQGAALSNLRAAVAKQKAIGDAAKQAAQELAAARQTTAGGTVGVS